MVLFGGISSVFAQTTNNTLPQNGNVGVGTMNPQVKLQVIGKTNLKGTLTVDSAMTLHDSLTVKKTLNVAKTIRVGGNALLKKRLTVKQDVLIGGKTTLTGTTKMLGNAKILGTTILEKRLTVKQDLLIGGKATFSQFSRFDKNVKVKGITTLQNKLNVTGIATFKNRLLVLKSGRFKSKLTVDGFTRIKGNARLDGTVKFTALADTAAAQEQFLMVKANGQLKGMNRGGLLKAIYTPNKTCLSLLAGSSIAVWSSVDQVSNGILYTGVDCPAKVGIGVRNPVATIDVRGDAFVLDVMGIGDKPNTQHQLNIKSTLKTVGISLINETPNTFTVPHYGIKNVVNHDNIIAYSVTKLSDNKDVFRVMGDGQVWATEVNIDLATDFPDYVFSSVYSLMPMAELRKFIDENNHLPNIPTAKDIRENGLGMAEMQLKQMEKIEELTLYLLELKNEIELIKQENLLITK